MIVNFAFSKKFSAAEKAHFFCVPAFSSRLKSGDIKPQFDAFERSQFNELFCDFQTRMKEVYPDVLLHTVLNSIVGDENNLYDEGTQKKIYHIPGVEDYLVAKSKKIQSCPENCIVPVKDELPEYYFGQPIASNNADLTVMKKIPGQTYSIPGYMTYARNCAKGEKLSPKTAKKILKSIEQAEEFPLSSYIDFANQVKYLSDNGLKIDFISSNNILIDAENKKFSYIDIIDRQERFADINPKGCVIDMICLLVNAQLFKECFESLNESDKEKLIKKAKSIVKKCKKAGAITGLELGANNAYKSHYACVHCLPDPNGIRQHMLDSYLYIYEKLSL